MSELFEKSLRTLELPRVLQLLSDAAVSAEAKERALRVSPETEAEEVLRLLDQTDAARQMIGQRGAPSFSGVKPVGEALDRAALARDFTQAVSDTLVPRAMEAARQAGRKTLVAAGGVAANSFIRADLERACREAGCRLYLPPLSLCGDNGAMIGAQGYYEYLAGNTAGMEIGRAHV